MTNSGKTSHKAIVDAAVKVIEQDGAEALSMRAVAKQLDLTRITFAQNVGSAKFESMPCHAVATGCVDLVLPPEEIAAELARIGRHPYITHPDAAEPGAAGNG